MQVTNSNKNIDTRYGDEVENQWKHSKGKTTTGVTYPKETIHYETQFLQSSNKTFILDSTH